VLEKQIEASPESADGYFQLGLILRESNLPKRGRKCLPGPGACTGRSKHTGSVGRTGPGGAEFPGCRRTRAAPIAGDAVVRRRLLLQGKIYFSEKRWDQARPRSSEPWSSTSIFQALMVARLNLRGGQQSAAGHPTTAGVLAKSPGDLRALTSSV